MQKLRGCYKKPIKMVSIADFLEQLWVQDREEAPALSVPGLIPFFPFLSGSCPGHSMSSGYPSLKLSILRAFTGYKHTFHQTGEHHQHHKGGLPLCPGYNVLERNGAKQRGTNASFLCPLICLMMI